MRSGHELFSQLAADKRLRDMGANRFSRRAERYGVGVSELNEPPHGQAAIVLNREFVEDLIADLPDPEASAGEAARHDEFEDDEPTSIPFTERANRDSQMDVLRGSSMVEKFTLAFRKKTNSLSVGAQIIRPSSPPSTSERVTTCRNLAIWQRGLTRARAYTRLITPSLWGEKTVMTIDKPSGSIQPPPPKFTGWLRVRGTGRGPGRWTPAVHGDNEQEVFRKLQDLASEHKSADLLVLAFDMEP